MPTTRQPACFALAAAALLGWVAPAIAMGQRPEELPIVAPEPGAGASLADVEASSGELLIVGPVLAVHTTRGRFEITTFPLAAPTTVRRVLHLARTGFFNRLAVHRALPELLAQIGDPATRDRAATAPGVGRNGSGQTLPPEFDGQLLRHQVGSVGMARGPQPNGGDSQFYLVVGPKRDWDGAFTIWGHVTQGMAVVRQLQVGDRIERIEILPPPGLAPKPSPAPSLRPSPIPRM